MNLFHLHFNDLAGSNALLQNRIIVYAFKSLLHRIYVLLLDILFHIALLVVHCLCILYFF